MTKLFLFKSTNPLSFHSSHKAHAVLSTLYRPLFRGQLCFLRCSDLSGKEHFKVKQHKMRCIIIYSCKLDHVSSLLPGPAQFLISPGIKAKVLTMAWKTCHPCPALWVSPLPLCCHPNAAPVQGGPFAVPPARQALCIGYILCF